MRIFRAARVLQRMTMLPKASRMEREALPEAKAVKPERPARTQSLRVTELLRRQEVLQASFP